MSTTKTSEPQKSPTEIGVLGVPLSKGQPKPGVDLGPHYLRETNLLSELKSLGNTIQDYGDLEFENFENDFYKTDGGPVIPNPRYIGAASRKISDTVSEIVKKGQTALTLGGDHSLAIGTVHGHATAQPDMCLIWVDAHADVNPPLESPSGNLHGIVLSLLLHETHHLIPKIEGLEWIKPCFHARNIAYIGLRDVDSGEKRIINENNITFFTMHDVDRQGIGEVVKQALKAVNPNLDKPIHLSFDIDSLDPTFAASTGTAVPGGLTLREGLYIVQELAATGKLNGVDMAEVNLKLGTTEDQKRTVDAARQIIAGCFGARQW